MIDFEFGKATSKTYKIFLHAVIWKQFLHSKQGFTFKIHSFDVPVKSEIKTEKAIFMNNVEFTTFSLLLTYLKLVAQQSSFQHADLFFCIYAMLV